MKKISIELLNKVANYLASRPYIEVTELLNELMRLENVEDPKVGETTGKQTSK